MSAKFPDASKRYTPDPEDKEGKIVVAESSSELVLSAPLTRAVVAVEQEEGVEAGVSVPAWRLRSGGGEKQR